MATAYKDNIAFTLINRFDGGIVNDPRDTTENTCRMATNFDIFTNPHKMTPYRSSEDGHGGASASDPRNFVVARRGTTEVHNVFAYSRATGSDVVHIQAKALTTGAGTDLDDNGWETFGNNEGTTTTRNPNCFVFYRKTSKIYGGHGGTAIWSFDATGVAAFNNTELSVTFTNMAQGLVHSKDDRLYIPYDNKIARNENGVWTIEALVLPAHFYITSICEMGNNIAIAMAPLSGAVAGQSRVFIWDRDVTLTTLSETVPWEEGQLQILEVIDGYLVGISISGNTATRHNVRVIFRFLDGNNIMGYRAKKFMELVAPTGQESAPPNASGTGAFALPIAKQMIDGRLHFLMQIYINGEQRDGVWSIGKVGDRFALNHERTPNNDTALTSATLFNFFYVGDYLFITYDD